MSRGITRLKYNGSWAVPKQIFVKQSNAWVAVREAFIKQNDEWLQVYPPPMAIPTLSPTSINFSVYIGDTITKTVQILNTGDDVLTITGNEVADNSAFSTRVLTTYPLIIQPGQTGSFTLSFKAISVDTKTETIRFNTVSQYLGEDFFEYTINGVVKPLYSRASWSPQSVSYSGYYGSSISASIDITNTGNGILTLNSVSASNSQIVSYPTNIYPNSKGTVVISPSSQTIGTTTDTLVILTNDNQNSIITVPVSVSISAPHGSQDYTTAGNYSFRVPAGVYQINITAVGGGGGGGGSTEVGNGGGGGGGAAGGYTAVSRSVTPGEYLTIVVGAGGAGSPYVGRDRGASGGGGTAQGGTTSQISGSFGSVIASGGPGGRSGTSGGGGAGGQGGGGSGANGQSGTRDNSSTAGGAGGSNGSGYGSGGAGASAPDRVSPYNWAGNAGSSGAVLLSW